MASNELYLGVDIGGTKCAVLIGDRQGEILERIAFATGLSRDPYEIVDEIVALAKELVERHCDSERVLVASGVSCGGPLDSKKGLICAPPNLPLWDDIPITDILQKELGVPAFLQNDANACAIAEWKFGSGQGFNNVIFLTFGTGLGAGLILDGKLYSGTNDSAGEVGHIRLTNNGPEGFHKNGSFEGYCSGNGIRELCKIVVRKKWGNGESVDFCENEQQLADLTAKDIFKLAADGSSDATEIVDICGYQLGRGLAVIVDILNPECIVIGSIYARAGHQLRDKMKEGLCEEGLGKSIEVCEIRPAALGDRVGDFAALTVAINGYSHSA